MNNTNKESNMSNTNSKGEIDVIGEVLKIFGNGYNKQVILYGPPGTGKTYYSTIIAANLLLDKEKNTSTVEGEPQEDDYKNNPEEAYEKAKEFLEFMGQDYYQLVQFHPSYNYDDFVRGINMSIDSDSKQPVYDVVDKLFGKFAETAANNKEKKYVLVIDEINRAPLASVLGELIYGLEYRGRKISTPYAVKNKKNDKENDKIVVPDNLYIIGTMNTADRSIGSIDYAVRRRFAFVPVRPDWNVVERSWDNGLEEAGLTNLKKEINQYVKRLWEQINGPVDSSSEDQIIKYEDGDVDPDDIKIGHSYFLFNEKKIKGKDAKIDVNKIKAYMNYRLEYEIKPILHEYRNDGLITNSKDEIDNINFGESNNT